MAETSVARARKLRRRMSQAELMLWTGLRRGNLGLHFRRQHPAAPFTLDFYCARARLAVEVDGVQHALPGRQQADERRDRMLLERGIVVLRVSAHDVMHNADGVLGMIKAAALERLTG